MRDPRSWISSMMNQIFFYKYAMPTRAKKYFEISWGRNLWPEVKTMNKYFLRDNLDFFESMLMYWNNSNKRVLDLTPKDRLLILKTNEINDSMDKIANFLNIPVELINDRNCHAHKAVDRTFYGSQVLREAGLLTKPEQIKPELPDWFEELDEELVNEKIDLYCGEIFRQFFKFTGNDGDYKNVI